MPKPITSATNVQSNQLIEMQEIHDPASDVNLERQGLPNTLSSRVSGEQPRHSVPLPNPTQETQEMCDRLTQSVLEEGKLSPLKEKLFAGDEQDGTSPLYKDIPDDGGTVQGREANVHSETETKKTSPLYKEIPDDDGPVDQGRKSDAHLKTDTKEKTPCLINLVLDDDEGVEQNQKIDSQVKPDTKKETSPLDKQIPGDDGKTDQSQKADAPLKGYTEKAVQAHEKLEQALKLATGKGSKEDVEASVRDFFNAFDAMEAKDISKSFTDQATRMLNKILDQTDPQSRKTSQAFVPTPKQQQLDTKLSQLTDKPVCIAELCTNLFTPERRKSGLNQLYAWASTQNFAGLGYDKAVQAIQEKALKIMQSLGHKDGTSFARTQQQIEVDKNLSAVAGNPVNIAELYSDFFTPDLQEPGLEAIYAYAETLNFASEGYSAVAQKLETYAVNLLQEFGIDDSIPDQQEDVGNPVERAQELLDKQFHVKDKLESFASKHETQDVSEKEITESLGKWVLGERRGWIREKLGADAIRSKIQNQVENARKNVLFEKRTQSLVAKFDTYVAEHFDTVFSGVELRRTDDVHNYARMYVANQTRENTWDSVIAGDFNEEAFIKKAFQHSIDLLGIRYTTKAPDLDKVQTKLVKLNDMTDVTESTVFGQGTNTCFMMSLANGLVMSEAGRKILETVTDEESKNIQKKDDFSAFERAMEKKIRQLEEKAKTEGQKIPSGFTLGTQWYDTIAAEALGLKDGGEVEIPQTKDGDPIRIASWNAIGKALHDKKIVTLFSGTRGTSTSSGHYRTVTGTWERDGKLGLTLRDSADNRLQYDVTLDELSSGNALQAKFFSLPEQA